MEEENIRKSMRNRGEEPEFIGLPTTRKARRPKVSQTPGGDEGNSDPGNPADANGSEIRIEASRRGSRSTASSSTSRRTGNTAKSMNLKKALEAQKERNKLQDEEDEILNEMQKRKLESIKRKKTELDMQKQYEDQIENETDSDNSQDLSEDEVGIDDSEKQCERKKVNCESKSEAESTNRLAHALLEAIRSSVPAKSNDNVSKFIVRQSIGKELPIFNGDPEDWPTFMEEFTRTTLACEFNDGENLNRLRKCLKGDAKEAVHALLISSENVSEIMKILKKRFGRPEIIIEKWIKKTQNLPEVKENIPASLIKFATFVKNLVVTIENLDRSEYLVNPQLLESLLDKLPMTQKFNWAIHAENKDMDVPSLREFSIWLEKVSFAVQRLDKSLCKDFVKASDRKEQERSDWRGQNRNVFMVKADEDRQMRQNCQFCEESSHNLRNCQKFSNISVDERWKWIREVRRCFSCLNSNHNISQCEKQKECGQNGCTKVHHPLLHSDPRERKENGTVCNTVERVMMLSGETLLRIAPVTLWGPSGNVDTYALFDDGSTTTLIEEELAEKIGLHGPKLELQLRGWNPNPERLTCQCVEVKISGKGMQGVYAMKNVKTVQKVDLPQQNVDMKMMENRWNHLKNNNVQSLKNAKPQLLIGEDNIHLIIPRELREGKSNEPILSRTKLGWVIHGNCSGHLKTRREFTFHLSEVDELHEMVKDSFKTENFGVQVIKNSLKSQEEQRADMLLEKTTKRIGNRFETGLLWKCDDVKLPDSRQMALSRLRIVEGKMDKNENYAKQYCEKIEDYMVKHYARKLYIEEASQLNPKIWHLPNFAVINIKQTEKMGLTFDAAAKINETILSDISLTGPDLYNSFSGLLCQFQQSKIAFDGDIRETSSHIEIIKEDFPPQRFLWSGRDRIRKPDVYESKIMLFGASCSPASARRFMDDYLDGCDSKEDTIKLVSSWRISQRYADMFWKRWIHEYLPTLVIAIFFDDQLDRNCWPIGIIIKIYLGKDGQVRIADCQEKFRRTITNICQRDVNLDDKHSLPSGGSNVTDRI